jgi:uncharacterized damage-inducible protein DinB
MPGMDSMLKDLHGHQAWADAEHWKALEAFPGAIEDATIRARLHHLHLVQHAFLWVATGSKEAFARTKPEDFPTATALKAFARDYHERVGRFVADVSDARLQESVAIPWFKDPPLNITVAQALAQCAMHSQGHRGQNATRLRQLGGTPPTTDLIVWWWKGRPEPDWA